MTDKSLIELETIRAEFEAWYVAGRNHFAKYELQPDEHGRYFNPFVQAGWAAWQAARLAVVPSVPEGCVVVPADALARLAALMDPPPVETGDGVMMVFKNPRAANVLSLISNEVRAMLAAAPQSPAIAAERVAELERDAARLDWLADPENMLGSVGLPRECVEPNIHSMREAIDMAMAMDKAIAGAGRG